MCARLEGVRGSLREALVSKPDASPISSSCHRPSCPLPQGERALSAACTARGHMRRCNIPVSQFQTASNSTFVPAARLRPGHEIDSPPRGVGGAPTGARVQRHPSGPHVTRQARRWRSALRPMTRDARLSALHRGDFWPGAALPSAAFPPQPVQRAPRSQVVVPGGRCPGPPGAAVTSRSRGTPLLAPPMDRLRKTPLDEQG